MSSVIEECEKKLSDIENIIRLDLSNGRQIQTMILEKIKNSKRSFNKTVKEIEKLRINTKEN